jgi:hypothetical protein
MLFILACITVLLLELNIYLFTTKTEVLGWLKQIEECSGNESTPDSPTVLYNGCFTTTFVGAVITGMIIGASLIKGRYSEGNFYRHFIIQSPGKITLRIVVLIGMFAILIPFAFVRTQNVYI